LVIALLNDAFVFRRAGYSSFAIALQLRRLVQSPAGFYPVFLLFSSRFHFSIPFFHLDTWWNTDEYSMISSYMFVRSSNHFSALYKSQWTTLRHFHFCEKADCVGWWCNSFQ